MNQMVSKLFVDFWESEHHVPYEAKRAKMVCFDFLCNKAGHCQSDGSDDAQRDT